MSVIEIVAVCFGVACVWLTIRQNIWCWPTGLVQVVLFIWIFYQAKLYSDVMLHVVYVVLGFYGWWYWLHGGREAKQPPVTRLPSKHLVLWIMLGAAGTAAHAIAANQNAKSYAQSDNTTTLGEPTNTMRTNAKELAMQQLTHL